MWGYRVSCLTAIAIKDRSHGIDLYTNGRRVCTSGLRLVGDPMTPSDVILVYARMNGNFKGGLNNVMLKNKGSVDDQRCVDNRHWPGTRTSLCDNPIRVMGGSDVRTVRFATLIGRTCARSVLARLGTSGSSIWGPQNQHACSVGRQNIG